MKDMNFQIQKSKWSPSRITIKKSMPRQIVGKQKDTRNRDVKSSQRERPWQPGRFSPASGEAWRRKWQPTPVENFWRVAWRIPWTEEPGGLLSVGSHRVGHDWSDLAYMHALEKEMAVLSSILAWRIPGTEEPGVLPSMGLHRVGHDWSDLAAAATEDVRKHDNHNPQPSW